MGSFSSPVENQSQIPLGKKHEATWTTSKKLKQQTINMGYGIWAMSMSKNTMVP